MSAIQKITVSNRQSKKTNLKGINTGFVTPGEFNEVVDRLNSITVEDGVIIGTLDQTIDDLTVTDDAAVGGDLTVTGASALNGAITQSLTTDSTSKDTGAIITEGGIGAEKAINAGTTITAGTRMFTGAGAVGTPGLVIGANDNGIYEVSSVQEGFSIGNTLVGGFNASGLFSNELTAQTALGSTPVGTVSIKEYSTGRDVVTELTLTNFIVGALAGAGAALAIGNIVYAYPAGQHLELVSSLSSLVLTCAGTAVATDTGLGSVIASGAVNVLSGTGTFEDRLTGQTINTAAGGGAAVSALTAATAGIGTGISLNVAGSVKDVFLNSAGTWNADNTGNLTASGTIVLKWTKM